MFDGELSFALKLAREMGRPDWRAMLAGMSSTEYADWHRFYSTHYFHDVLLDMHFSGLTYTVLSLFFSDPETPRTQTTDNGKQNTYFSSLDNMVAQGNVLPVLYGEMRVGSRVASQEISTADEGDGGQVVVIGR